MMVNGEPFDKLRALRAVSGKPCERLQQFIGRYALCSLRYANFYWLLATDYFLSALCHQGKQ